MFGMSSPVCSNVLVIHGKKLQFNLGFSSIGWFRVSIN